MKATFARIPYEEYKARRKDLIIKKTQVVEKKEAELALQKKRWAKIYQEVKYDQDQCVRDPETGRLLKKKMKTLLSAKKHFEKEEAAIGEKPEGDPYLHLVFPENVALPNGKRVLGYSGPLFRGDKLLIPQVDLQLYGPGETAIIGERVRIYQAVTLGAKRFPTDARGGLPLLAPMSEVAGRLAPQVGAWTLQKANGGSGVLLGGVPGVAPANVVIVGGGVVGTAAARVAVGMGARVTVLDRSVPRLSYLDDIFHGKLVTQYSSAGALAELLHTADMVVGAVLIPGAAAPKLVSRAQLKQMKPGSVLVDVAIDQGGCFETSRATTHQDPIYEVDGVMHYCVANMPGAVARTSTQALGNATMPFMLALADKGWKRACAEDRHLLAGLNVHAGKLTYEAVGAALGLPSIPAADALKG